MNWDEPKKQRWVNMRVLSWALFDTGTTIFSMLVLSRYFGPWVVNQMKGSTAEYNDTAAASMLFAAILQLLLSPISDELSRRRIFVVWFTLASILACGLISVAPTLKWGLVLFGAANVGYQVALVFYNAMLGDVSDEKHRARISGLGIGVGYIGSIIGLLASPAFVSEVKDQWNYSPIFKVAALLFLGFALPLFWFVKEKPSFVRLNLRQSLTNSIGSLVITARRVSRNREMLFFFIACLLILDAVHTVILNMALYCEKVAGLDPVAGFNWSWKNHDLFRFDISEMNLFLILSTVFGIFGAFIIGYIADKTNRYKVLLGVVCIWMLALILAMFSVQRKLFWVAGPLFGLGFAGIWTVSRAYLLELCHPEERGQMFAFFGIVGKGAAIMGPFLWARVFNVFEPLYGDRKAYRIAIGTMLGLMCIGFWILLLARPKSENPRRLSGTGQW
jgi:MFS transporter, UMF1 family